MVHSSSTTCSGLKLIVRPRTLNATCRNADQPLFFANTFHLYFVSIFSLTFLPQETFTCLPVVFLLAPLRIDDTVKLFYISQINLLGWFISFFQPNFTLLCCLVTMKPIYCVMIAATSVYYKPHVYRFPPSQLI